MNVVIFGSTGSVGRPLVREALAQGHQVTAFARRPEKLGLEDAGSALTVVQGDVTDADAVERAVAGHDAVICVLGAGRKGRVRAAGTRNIVRAMERTGVKRLVCQSTLGVGESSANLNFFWKHLMFGMLLKGAFADHVEQEEVVRESGLDWVIVRPGAFTDGAATGEYRHGFGPDEPGLALKISRADLVGFLLEQLENDVYIGKTPGVSY